MNDFLHTLFVILANVICWGSLLAGIVAFFGFLWIMITDKRTGSDPHDPNSGFGMPWG